MATQITNLVAAQSTGQIVGSLWDGLNSHLIGHVRKLRKNGQKWEHDANTPAVAAALTETSLEVALNWQSPFESSGTESQAPALAAMLQTGSLQPLVAALTGSSSEGIGADLRQKANSQLSEFEGRTGVTKLNSTQVFSGMPPIKISTTLLLRAWRDPVAEVERPLEYLMSWLLPQKLSPDGSVIARGVNTAKGSSSLVEMLMPSLAPVPVSLRYKRRLYMDMVIENITVPLDSPIDVRGNYVQLALPMTFCSMAAIDHADWKAYGPL